MVSMTAATPTVSFLSSSLGVGVMDMDFNSAGAALEFTGGGDYVFPFTVLEQFGIDLENIREILVQVSSEEPATVRSYAISAVTVGFVPERTLGVLAVSAVA